MTQPDLDDLSCALTAGVVRRANTMLNDDSDGSVSWCDDCHGYTHMPWCPQCVEGESGKLNDSSPSDASGVSEVVSDGKNAPLPAESSRTGFLATGSGCCERCAAAEEQERRQRQHEPQTVADDPRLLWADAATVRAAIFDVTDAGCNCESGEKHPWELDEVQVDEENLALIEEIVTLQRVRFADAVTARIRELQQLHDYPRIEQYCETHKRSRLPAYNGWCLECPVEKKEKQ